MDRALDGQELKAMQRAPRGGEHEAEVLQPTRGVLSSRLSLVLSCSDSPIDDDYHRFLYFRTRRCRAQMW